MDPTADELAQIRDLQSVFDWVGVEDTQEFPQTNFKSAFLQALGCPTLVRQIVAIPLVTYERATKAIQVNVTPREGDNFTRAMTPVEEGHVVVVRRVCRLSQGLPPEEDLLEHSMVALAPTGKLLSDSNRGHISSRNVSNAVFMNGKSSAPSPVSTHSEPVNTFPAQSNVKAQEEKGGEVQPEVTAEDVRGEETQTVEKTEVTAEDVRGEETQTEEKTEDVNRAEVQPEVKTEDVYIGEAQPELKADAGTVPVYERVAPSGSQTLLMFFAVMLPNILLIICFSAVGFGLKVYDAMAPKEMNAIGNCGAAACGFLLMALYVFDYNLLGLWLQAPLGLIQFALLIGSAVLKCIFYPWAPMMFTILMTYIILLVMRTSVCRHVTRKYFYLAVGTCTLFCAVSVMVVWVVWMFNGNQWNQETKDKLVADTQNIYANIYSRNGVKQTLVYEVHCKPGVDLELLGYTEEERQTITSKCKLAATVWFLVWMAPFISVTVHMTAAMFSFMVAHMGTAPDATQLQKSLKRFVFVFMAMLTGMYGSVYASSGLMSMGSALMAFCATVLTALIVWVYLEVPHQVVEHIAKGSKITGYLVKAYHSDIVRAAAVIMVNALIPLFILLDACRKKVRRCRGLTNDPGTYTLQGQKLVAELSTWNWVGIFNWICTLCAVAFVLNVGMKITYVFFSWLNSMLETVPLELVIILVFAVGLCMFLLPPVPGSAVYVFAGIVLGRKSQEPGSVGFIPGIVIAGFLGLVTKLFACVGQYMIGYFAGKSVKVQQLIGVDKVFTRAIEALLRRRGLEPGKVAILVGGPDWPTSVTCGILKLNIPQMLLGTLPVGIVSVFPQTLMGAMLTKESDNESGIWTMVAAGATGVSVIGQVGAMLVATYFTTSLIEKNHKELQAPRPEHRAVEELTMKEQAFVDKYQELTYPYTMLSNTRGCTWFIIKCSVVLHLIAFFIFGSDFIISDPMCFRKFAIINDIGAAYDKGGLNNNVINLVIAPFGWIALLIFFVAAALHYFWAKSVTFYAKSRLGKPELTDVQKSAGDISEVAGNQASGKCEVNDQSDGDRFENFAV